MKQNKDERVSVRIPSQIIEDIEELVQKGNFKNMSEFIRECLETRILHNEAPAGLMRVVVDFPQLQFVGLNILVHAGDALSVEDAVRNAVRDYLIRRPKEYAREKQQQAYMKNPDAIDDLAEFAVDLEAHEAAIIEQYGTL